MAVLVVVLGGVGCTDPALPGVAVPTHDQGGNESNLAEIEGRLAGAADVDGGCVWLEQPDDRGPLAVLWPPGTRADFDPVRLLDGNGNVIATEGDLLALGGGYGAYPEMTRCRLGTEEIARVSAPSLRDLSQ